MLVYYKDNFDLEKVQFTMKLLNWNVYYRNKEPRRVVQFIDSINADIICLQEVPAKLKDELVRGRNYIVKECVDYYRSGADTFLLILTKKQPLQAGVYTYFHKPTKSLLHSYWHFLFELEQNHQSLYVDIEINQKVLRFHNVHLTWDTTPSVRIEQLQSFFSFRNQFPQSVIMGDLNTFSNKFIGVLAAIPLSYKFEDISIDERKVVDQMVSTAKLQNPYKGVTSWPLIKTGFQMDHILIPEGIEISNVQFLKETYGSDHLPQIVEVNV